jgi:hypothetical protein
VGIAQRAGAGGLSLAGLLTAPLLLVLTFSNGIGLALRWPVFAAIVPQIVSRAELPAALALNGIAMNLSRVVGPVLAGALLAAFSPAVVFVLNAVLAGVAFVLILRWKSAPRTSALPGERFVGAMRVGLNYAMQSPRLKVVLLRIFLFFLQSTALVALLPLVARSLHGGGAGTFTVMLSCLGGGAIVAALYFPRWRARFDRDQFVWIGTLVHAALSCLIVLVPEIWVALPAMVRAGHGLDLGGQYADRFGAGGDARLGARAWHVDLPDGADGRCGGRFACCGARWPNGPACARRCWRLPAFGVLVLLLTRRLSVEGDADSTSPRRRAARPASAGPGPKKAR